MGRSTVAVVMSNYNHGRYLSESLGGIRAQTRPADEVIIIDDASTDGSATIIRDFAASLPTARFLQNEERLGVQASIARALPLVRSDYLVWTAADDVLLPGFLEKSMAPLERHPTASLCFSETTQLVGDTGVIVAFAAEPALRRTFDLSDLPEYMSPARLEARMKGAYLPIAANTVVVKRSALQNLKGYPRQLEWYADSFAYTAIALRHGACVVPETLALIRAVPGSYSQGMHDPARQCIVLRQMLELLASSDYRDIRRSFRACPSNFSPGGTLMLRTQAEKVRDWDLLVPYLWWKIREYRRGHGLTWPQTVIHLFKLAFASRELIVMRRELVALRNELDVVVKQFRSVHQAMSQEVAELRRRTDEIGLGLNEEVIRANEGLRSERDQLRASRDGLANTLASERREHEAAKTIAEDNRRILDGAGLLSALAPAAAAQAPRDDTSWTADFDAMFAEMRRADAIYAPSRFWEHYNALNLAQFKKQRLANFKLTANQNYHNFTPLSLFDSKIRRLIKFWMRAPTLKPLLFSLETAYASASATEPPVTQQAFLGLSSARMAVYRTFVALLWVYSQSIDKYGVLGRLEEPELGNPIRIRAGKKLVSQDLATSSREFNTIMAQVDRGPNAGRLVIGELGAGYGRLAHVFLEMADCRYVIVDIPPALGVAQWYLGNLLPNKRIFRFRSFDRFDSIADELEDSEIAFFTPNQLAKFPERYFDLMISISSLHEMRPDQIAHYLELLPRLTKEHIYLKQYRRYINPIDDIVVERDIYRVPDSWEIAFERDEDVYGDFFELMLKRRAAG